MAKLTPARQRFADEYLIDLNATRAYKAAYLKVKDDNVAGAAATRLLGNVKVKDYITERMNDRSQRTEVTQDMVVKELARVAFASGAEFAQVVEKPAVDPLTQQPLVGADGKPVLYQRVILTPTDQLTADQRAAIAGIKEGKNGIEVATCDKVKALELLGRHLGMFTDNIKMSNAVPVQIINDIPKGDNDGG